MYECRKCVEIAKEMTLTYLAYVKQDGTKVVFFVTGEEILYSRNANEKDYHTKGVAVINAFKQIKEKPDRMGTSKPEPDKPARVEPGEDNINKCKVKKAIKSFKNEKSADIDGLPLEVFKSGGNEITEYLYKFLNKIWDEEKIPTEWVKRLLVKLP
ncbi:unnamed protein product [Mytilus coruscus]|uniref:Uncharacterized protein n=1 Tax=Mytilus coruscus TaxID=42192 RepID=A0A6J8AY18_MYTCO|nr:unnamed protein product [Mytilus coruscus]